jgi:polyphosphate kinase
MHKRKTPAKTSSAKPSTRSASAKSASAKSVRDLDQPQFFINRELSWLEFNHRVLEEAQNPDNPVLERLKFLTIFSSNLDEFFEIRVAGLQQAAETQPGQRGPDGMTPDEVLHAISNRVCDMVSAQYQCYREEVAPALAEAGIDLHTVDGLDEKGRAWAESYFRNEVFPVLTPLAIDPAHPFPQLLNKSLNLAVVLSIPDTPNEMDGLRRDDDHEDTRFGVVQVPRVLPRLIALPPEVSPPGRRVYVFLSSLIGEFIGQLFPGLEVEGCYAFRVTRNSELYLDEDEADNLLEAMREQLQRRRRGDAVRLEVQRGCDPAVVQMLLETFELEQMDLYEVDGPVNLPRLMAVYSGEKRPDLKDPTFVTAKPRALRDVETPAEFFQALREDDILLHHPYDSFKSVVDFVQMAADDPQVLAIKQTLYRTSGDSPIVRALMKAAENGKQVTALVELKARFDEENNIQWARRMEEAGVHVLYGLVGLKTHCKVALVVRREGAHIRRYVHLGTGNYNPTTARLYTDVGLLSSREELGNDAAKIFNLLTGMSQFPGLDKLKMAPFGLHAEFIQLIDREAAHAKKQARQASSTRSSKNPKIQVQSPPRIVAKMNSLVDAEIIKALYRASQSGVQIDLIVRGICCLRPGVAGVSDNIRVHSIVDRFLEHPRVFLFANNGQEEIYCGSADWMPRNFFRRIEVVFPIETPALKDRLREEVLGTALADNVKSRLMKSDGTYAIPPRKAGEEPIRSQTLLLALAQRADRSDAAFEGRAAAEDANAKSSTRSVLSSGIFTMTPRAAPRPMAGAGDARAGTEGDPVLRAMENEPPTRETGHESERRTTTVVSEEEPVTREELLSRELKTLEKAAHAPKEVEAEVDEAKPKPVKSLQLAKTKRKNQPRA